MVPKVNPVFYLVSMFFGYVAGFNSHGSWWPFVWIIIAFVCLRILAWLGRSALTMF